MAHCTARASNWRAGSGGDRASGSGQASPSVCDSDCDSVGTMKAAVTARWRCSLADAHVCAGTGTLLAVVLGHVTKTTDRRFHGRVLPVIFVPKLNNSVGVGDGGVRIKFQA